jgi:hypothetical protein
MARATYRRRDDGVYEILKPSRLRLGAAKIPVVAGALLALVALAGLFTAYVLVAFPLLLVVALVLAVPLTRRRPR